jgi:hypothetical protein
MAAPDEFTFTLLRGSGFLLSLVGAWDLLDSVEGNRIRITDLLVDTAPERGAPGDMEFAIDGDMLMITWLSTTQTRQTPHHVDIFRRRSQPVNNALFPEGAIYESWGRARDV